MNKLTVATIVASLSMLAAQLGQAEETEEARATRVVHFSDLNLASPDGVAVLYARLRRAAHDLCAPFDGAELERARRFRACIDEVLSTTIAQADLPTLAEYYRSTSTARNRHRAEVVARR